MKSTKLALVFLAAIGGSLVSASADAHWRHHHRGARIGVFIGAPVAAYSYYAYPRYYYPAPVVAPAPVYVEPNPPAQTSSNYWYYCRESGAYYPYVQTCPSPWQPVVPN
jgi:hypothetical protein